MAEMRLVPPQDPQKNIQYRREVRKWAIKSRANVKYLTDACREDFFFWATTFAWLYEPRAEKDKVVPFIPWVHQVPVIESILQYFGKRDIIVEKSRGEGATWIALLVILHRWLFNHMEAFGIVSRNEMAVDNPDDPDSIGYKADWELAMMPRWMTGIKGKDYTRNISKHTWYNRNNLSSITAYSTTGELASGGRKTAFFIDELSKFQRGPDEEALASTEPVTESRLIVSTPFGDDGAYYNITHQPSSAIRLTLCWEDNPVRNRGSFLVSHEKRVLTPAPRVPNAGVSEDYTEIFFRDAYEILSRRGFDVGNPTKIWSPWYVERCLRPSMNPQIVAREYDRSYAGSATKFFPLHLIELLKKRARMPDMRVDLIIHPEKLVVEEFSISAVGQLKLWINLQGKNPPADDYIIGVDIASGQGQSMSSNSIASIVRKSNGIKVAEFCDNRITPENLANVVVALARWFVNKNDNEAYVIWEANGYGEAFRDQILSTNFRNFYYRTRKNVVMAKPSKAPGFWTDTNSKRGLLSRYRWALNEGLFENPCLQAVEEAGQYQEVGRGRIVFISKDAASTDEDEGVSHGDRVFADALANLAREELEGSLIISETVKVKRHILDPPSNSFAGRRQRFLDDKKRELSW